MTPPHAPTAAAALTATALILAAGCATADGAAEDGAAGTTEQSAAAPDGAQSVAVTSTADPGFFDPCTDDMLAWFADRGLPKAKYIEPEKDDTFSGCDVGNSTFGASIGAQVSRPGDATDQWVHEVLHTSGQVVAATVANHPAELSISKPDGNRQDCYVLVPVRFGFLEVVGGPHGTPASPPPRDCDRARTIAAAVLAKMDE